jgi:hypothetical protein
LLQLGPVGAADLADIAFDGDDHVLLEQTIIAPLPGANFVVDGAWLMG